MKWGCINTTENIYNLPMMLVEIYSVFSVNIRLKN